jgi:hypothetical protein
MQAIMHVELHMLEAASGMGFLDVVFAELSSNSSFDSVPE